MNTNEAKRGPGQPKKEATTVLSFRVPEKWAEEIKKQVKSIIQNLTK